jgi:ankyrin repeat protein
MKLRTFTVATAISVFGVSADAQSCGILCSENFWETASQAEVAAEISKADVYAQDDGGRTALMFAAGFGSAEVVEALLDAGADVNAREERGQTALMFAAMFGSAEVVEALLDAGADVTVISEDGMTVWDFAEHNTQLKGTDTYWMLNNCGILCSENFWKTASQAEVAAEISKADVYAQDDGGRTALMFAAGFGTAEVVETLLDAGADVNAREERGQTALMFAGMLYGTAEVVEALLDAGADVNAREERGRTALMFAVRFGTAEVVEALLDAGADATVISEDGRTAWDFAEHNTQFKGTDTYWMLNNLRFK